MLRRYMLTGAMVLVLMAILMPRDAKAAGCEVHTSLSTLTNLYVFGMPLCDANGAQWVTKATQDGGEHIGATEADGYQRVITDVLSSGQKTADAQIKASAGYISHMTCQGADAAAVAGTIIIYDSLTETGTAVYTFTVAALDYHIPMVFPILYNAATGVYLGYTTTSDMACTVFYR